MAITFSLQPRRLQARSAVALALSLLLPAALAGCGGSPTLRASIPKPAAGYYRLAEPVPVRFDAKINARSLQVSVEPAANVTVAVTGKVVTLTPVGDARWTPGSDYTVIIKRAERADHQAKLTNWKGHFSTQPHLGLAGLLLDGNPVTGQPRVSPASHLGVAFTSPMKPESTVLTVNDQPVDPKLLKWSADFKAAMIDAPLSPYRDVHLSVKPGALTATGDQITDLTPLAASVLGLVPSNASSGVDPNFKPVPPILVVIDNAGAARPQAGLQDADTVFEYISEYGISRFTLVYQNHPPDQIGPVRSCRMINVYLINDFDGVQMCSGASVGTLHYIFGDGTPNMPYQRSNINDFDKGGHFYRVGFKAAPHNLFTSRDRAERLRSELGYPPIPYAVDAVHPDVPYGSPADPPSIGLHGVTYAYDGGDHSYRPFDYGSPRVDINHGGDQLHVKNVVVMHVPFHDAGWVEDDNGGAHSIWYEMNGSGPAEIWSDGQAISATWHQAQEGQNYFSGNQPVWFTDAAGNLIRLNTGLTWIHVVGNGQ